MSKPWIERDGNARPTKERYQRGQYRTVAADQAGSSYLQDSHSTPLRRAFEYGKIERRQLDAGEQYEALIRAMCGSPGPRSCLDLMPRGNGEAESEYQVRQRQVFKEVCWAVGREASAILMDVCLFHNGTGPRRNDARRWVKLTEGLTTCADYWGLPEDESQD